ncbi:hypothetical protein AB4Y45_27905 [Paraburkholderia sp. EG287A]|uniref:hypothetical protein n=1 Tax=Paraburkholderia sp. EG287A TaxID=3237012 RepID=UPI0034D18111
MNLLRLKLMRREGMRRLQDAEALSGLQDADAMSGLLDSDGMSDSHYLLRLLALELLLKCLCLASGCDAKKVRGHNYDVLFQTLPEPTKEELLRLAKSRLGRPTGLTGNLHSILGELSANFIDLRYPYEKYESLDERRYVELGDKWIAEGAPLEKATFRYHSEELFGLTYALVELTRQFEWD